MQKNPNLIRTILVTFLVLGASLSCFSQTTKSRKPPVKKTTSSTTGLNPQQQTQVPAKLPLKKNERPDANSDAESHGRSNKGTVLISTPAPTYFYEFSQRDFAVSKIIIEHNEAGAGKISFLKKGNEELISDPIQLSPAALERINNALSALDFINSDASYQYVKDYSHMGTIKFRLSKAGRERNTTFNWTENKDAKILMDEYRKVGNQFVWIFDISVARENQPLESPKLLIWLESLLRRNEISDPAQMLPFLRVLTNDERIPMIARNHAGRLIAKIEKEKK